MNIASPYCVLLIICTLSAYYVLPAQSRWLALLVASMVFYSCSGMGSLALIICSSAVSFAGARMFSHYTQLVRSAKKSMTEAALFTAFKKRIRTRKRIVLFAILAVHFGLLACMKYLPHPFLPAKYFSLLGISFYTFQMAGYVIDVYNGKYGAEKNFLRYLLFTTFFPYLIQGPINRYDSLGKELSEPHSFDFENVRDGLLQILIGALKKYAIADMLSPYISRIFDSRYDNLPGCIIVFGILHYSLYQYADFSGGIDMVLGIARLFGIKMQPNFRQPYFSTSLADFWRRWHISLGLWMRDYVFYPLALTKAMQSFGRRCGRLNSHLGRTLPACIANIVVFFLVGIWHGVEMHFIVWGLYNGIVIAVGDLCEPLVTRVCSCLRMRTTSAAFYLFRIIRTFVIVNVGWYFDRITDIGKCFRFLANTVTKFHAAEFHEATAVLFNGLSYIKGTRCIAGMALLIAFAIEVMKERNVDVYAFYGKRNVAVRWGFCYLCMIIIMVSFHFVQGHTGFMYAQY